MRKKRLALAAMLIGISTLIIPLAASLYLAWDQGREDASDYLEVLTTAVIRRSAGTLAQVNTAVNALKEDSAEVPCSPGQLNNMRMLAARAHYLQGLAYIKGNVLMCSTLTPVGKPAPLGPPDRINPNGSRAWSHKVLPSIPDTKFNINERDGYAAIIAPGLVIDILPERSPISLAQIGRQSFEMVRAHGAFKSEWLEHYQGQAVSFFDDEHLVIIRPTGTRNTAVLAAMPISMVNEYRMSSARQFGPIGFIAGILLACAVYLVARYRLSFKVELQSALNKKEFFLMYQPVIDLRTDRCVGAEALIRWNQRGGKIASPASFIPAAEENGLIQKITEQVMEMVAHDAADLIKNNPDTHISINFSAEDLDSPETEKRLQNLIKNAGAMSHNIVIEATERGLAAPDKENAILISVRSKGFKVAIDDFGTGHSSLSYLATYDLDFLKIDKMFVDSLESECSATNVAFHIIEVAKSLGLKMIAEGVETQAQRDILRDAGVQFAQGFFFARPMPMQELAEFIRVRNGSAAD